MKRLILLFVISLSISGCWFIKPPTHEQLILEIPQDLLEEPETLQTL